MAVEESQHIPFIYPSPDLRQGSGYSKLRTGMTCQLRRYPGGIGRGGLETHDKHSFQGEWLPRKANKQGCVIRGLLCPCIAELVVIPHRSCKTFAAGTTRPALTRAHSYYLTLSGGYNS